MGNSIHKGEVCKDEIMDVENERTKKKKQVEKQDEAR